MTYNSYSNYQRLHTVHCQNYMDGVPMALSDHFKPPPKIKVPRELRPRHICDILEAEYDFGLERRVLAEAESRRMAELAEQEASRVASAIDDLSRAEAVSRKPKDPGKPALNEKKEEKPSWSIGSEILTPVPIGVSSEISKVPETAQIRVKDFETVDDPFDDLELKVLDDMAELKSVLDVVQQSTSPSLVDSNVESTNQSCEALEAGTNETVPVVGANGTTRPGVEVTDNILFNKHGSDTIRSRSGLEPVKRKPVNLDDYNISLPDTDHLMTSYNENKTLNHRKSFGGASVDLGLFVANNNVASLPATNSSSSIYNGYHSNNPCSPYAMTGNCYGTQFRNSPNMDHSAKPVICESHGHYPIGYQNGRSSVIGCSDHMTFDEYRYAGHKLRSARSASDLRDVGSDENATYRFSHSTPPRTPSIQARLTNGGRYSPASVLHSDNTTPTAASTNQQREQPAHRSAAHLSLKQQCVVSSLPDPFTSLSVEDQEFVCMFVDMGFPRPRTARAVSVFGKDAKQVTDYLCLCDGLVEQGYPPDRVELASQLADNQIKQAKEYLKVMKQLHDFGFKQADIHRAMKLHQADTDKCLDYLTAPT